MMVRARSLRYIHVRACPYCGKAMDPSLPGNHPKAPTKDHVHPKSRGGRWHVMVCSRCNNHKSDHTIREWLEMLRAKGDERVAWIEQFIIKHARAIADDEARDWGRRDQKLIEIETLSEVTPAASEMISRERSISVESGISETALSAALTVIVSSSSTS
jgi:hypothetical protein